MHIILKEDIDKVGNKNDIVSVKTGFARNFLIPQGKAICATESARKVHAENVKQRAKKDEKAKADANALAEKLASCYAVSVDVIAQRTSENALSIFKNQKINFKK